MSLRIGIQNGSEKMWRHQMEIYTKITIPSLKVELVLL